MGKTTFRHTHFLLMVFESLLFMVAGAKIICGHTWKGYAVGVILAILAGWCDEVRKRFLREQWEQEI